MCLRAVISQRLIRGTSGKQIPAVEILINTTHIAELIKNDEIDKIRDAIESSVSAGSQTFEQALYKLFKSGMINKEEAMRNADSASNLSALIDFSQTAKHKVYDPNAPHAQTTSPANASATDFGSITLNLDAHEDK